MKHIYIFSIIVCLGAFALLLNRYGITLTSALYMLLILILTITAVIDIREGLIYDRLVAACLVIGLASVRANEELTIASSALACLLCGGTLLLASLATKGGIGMGDAKLFAAVSASLGIGASAAALALSAVLSGFFGLVLLCISIKNMKKSIPFAPFILLATIIVLLS